MEEERDLSDAYRASAGGPKPQGQGLNDLYVRFFRMAERRIVEKPRHGRRLLHLQLFLAGWLSFTGNARAVSRGV